MFRLQSAITHIDSFLSRLFQILKSDGNYTPASSHPIPVTVDCVPNRRRRVRRSAVTSAGEPLRSTWF